KVVGGGRIQRLLRRRLRCLGRPWRGEPDRPRGDRMGEDRRRVSALARRRFAGFGIGTGAGLGGAHLGRIVLLPRCLVILRQPLPAGDPGLARAGLRDAAGRHADAARLADPLRIRSQRMVEASMIAPHSLFALVLTVALPSVAFAQDQGGDPGEVLQGLWHVDHVEGSAANDTMSGSILKIDRQAIASLSGGTCSSPSFAPAPAQADPKQAGIDITCLGQAFASAHWNTDDLDTVDWSEPNLDVVLHRV